MMPCTTPVWAAMEVGPKATNYDRVVAWDDDGHPLLVGPRGLVRADEHGGFKGLTEMGPGQGRVDALIPAPGWTYEWTDEDDAKHYEPLVGFGLKDGYVVPVNMDGDGLIMPMGKDYELQPPAVDDAVAKSLESLARDMEDLRAAVERIDDTTSAHSKEAAQA